MLARIVKKKKLQGIYIVLIYDSGKYLHKQKRLTIRLFIVTAYTLINLIFLENVNWGHRVFCGNTEQE
jgi:hypothetical protein